MSPTPFPRPPCALRAATPTRRGKGRDSLASRRTGHGRRRTQRSTSAQAQATAACPTGLLNPDDLWHGEPDGHSPCPTPPVYIPRNEPRRTPTCPHLCPARHAGTRPPTPVGAGLMPARPLPPCGCPEAARPRPLALRHASAILGRSRPFAPRAPSPHLARGCQGSPRSPLQAPAKAKRPHAPSRVVTRHPDWLPLVAFVTPHLAIGPGSPPDWSVFMWMIELTCGSLFGRLLPSCISVLSFIVSILVVIRSL